MSDAEFAEARKQFAGFELANKEEFFYLRALARDHGCVSRDASENAARAFMCPKAPPAMPGSDEADHAPCSA